MCWYFLNGVDEKTSLAQEAPPHNFFILNFADPLKDKNDPVNLKSRMDVQTF
jgi:hypothetical protein